MAKGIDNHFADNWQKAGSPKENYSSRLHQQGEVARAAARVTEKAKFNAAESSKLNHNSKPDVAKPAASIKDIPQAVRSARVETQGEAQAVKSRELAEQNFQTVRRDAQNLKSLEKNVKEPAASSTSLTDAVTQKPQTATADFGRNASAMLQQGAAHSAAKTAGKDTPKGKDGAKSEPRAKTKNAGEGEVEKAAQPKLSQTDGKEPQPAAAAMEGARAAALAEQNNKGAVDGEEGIDGEDDTRTEDNEGKSTVYSAKASGREKSRKLGTLLGGFSGGDADAGAGEGSQSPAAVAVDTKREPLPETDPSFHVFSEFDSDVAGPHTIKAKYQVFSSSVEKKLREIASFDVELGNKIQALSERISGELKDELKTAKFLGSIYGGLIG